VPFGVVAVIQYAKNEPLVKQLWERREVTLNWRKGRILIIDVNVRVDSSQDED